MPHNGTDFGAPTGTPIYASSYGTITKRGDYGPNGNFVAIQHDHGYETGYSHLSRFEEGLGVGDKVKRAQVVGYVGTTGRSTGPHLHFSARKNGAYIDPETLQFDALSVLPPEERADFAKVRAQYDEMLDAVALPPPLAAEPAPATTATAPSLDLDMTEEGEEELLLSDHEAAATPPNQPAAASSPVVVPAGAVGKTGTSPTRAGASLYLSDEELMKSQAASDEGEVEE
jgi:murein DD-endopeptidase MepM/ murein hydrolase activator NlpD